MADALKHLKERYDITFGDLDDHGEQPAALMLSQWWTLGTSSRGRIVLPLNMSMTFKRVTSYGDALSR